jgi:putative tricarboxylic transport membrane protein
MGQSIERGEVLKRVCKPSRKKMKIFSRLEFIVYCVFCAAAAAIIVPSVRLGLGGKEELGPGLLPFLASLCVLATGAVLAILTLLRREKVNPSAELEKIDRKGWIRVGEILFSFAVWPLLVGVIGYIISTFLVSLGMAKAIGYKGWLRPIILSISITFCIWFLFGFMFHLDLPAGFSF